MSTSKLVSVIVPVYNVEEYLDRCVQSITDQTDQNLEIILVDDGSPDRCPAMCDAWAERDKRIKVIHKPNGGLSDARNEGMAAATGEYLSFVDSDDWLAPEMLERLLTALERDDSDIAACAVEMVWEDGRPNELLTVQTNCVLDRQEAQRALLKETLLKQPVWYKLYRRETIQDIPFEVGRFHEDVFWSYQAVGNARRVSLIDYVGYFYFQRKGSIMGEGYSMKRLDAVEAMTRRHTYLKENFPELEQDSRIRLVNSCIYHGQMALKHLPSDQRREALTKIEGVKNRYQLKRADYAVMKPSRRAWLRMALLAFKETCWIRNALGIGH